MRDSLKIKLISSKNIIPSVQAFYILIIVGRLVFFTVESTSLKMQNINDCYENYDIKNVMTLKPEANISLVSIFKYYHRVMQTMH